MPISIHPVSCSIIRFVRYVLLRTSRTAPFSLPFSSPYLSFYLLLLMFTFFASTFFFLLCCAVNTSWAIFDIFLRLCVGLCVSSKFLENENHISIIQRLVTETHSYSGRSRLTPVNPKIGNECCCCCCYSWCERKRRVWKKYVERTWNSKYWHTRIWKTNTLARTHAHAEGDRDGRNGGNAFQFRNIDKIWRIILTKC